MMNRRAQSGTTLIELIMTIVVLSLGMAAIFKAIGLTSQHGADPMALQQAINIGEAYLSEIASKSFPATASPCNPSNTVGGRTSYNDTCDYNGLSQPPTNQLGIALPNLGAYQVTVAVQAVAVGAIAAADMLRIDVTVTRADAGIDITLSAYRPRI
jgi:MSHA pilin protein MshD